MPGGVLELMSLYLRIRRRVTRTAVFCLQLLGTLVMGKKGLICYGPGVDDATMEEVARRLAFYLPLHDPKSTIHVRSSFSPKLLTLCPTLLLGTGGLIEPLFKYRPKSYYVDHTAHYNDGAEWSRLASDCAGEPPKREVARATFVATIERLRKLQLSKAYLFGTGPSLKNAFEHDWSDGYRLVCNTVVKDRSLWKHINPHILVAGDPIYHFGPSSFAKAFRKDLSLRLSETETVFVYPELHHAIVMRELQQFEDRLIPMPCRVHNGIVVDFFKTFALPTGPNVLNILLLPLGCFLSQHILLWGFDGRAPGDRLFWSNSVDHTYAEHMEDLLKSHPKFFEHHIPNNDLLKYSREVHGALLENNLAAAEAMGWRFEMMHDTWTATLARRQTRKARASS